MQIGARMFEAIYSMKPCWSKVRSAKSRATLTGLPDFSSALPCFSFTHATRCAGLAWVTLQLFTLFRGEAGGALPR